LEEFIMTKKLLIKNIKSLVTCDANDNVFENVNLYAEDGVIKHIGNEEFEADEIIYANDMLVYPGLINTHHHLYQTFTRNLPQVQNLELFDWLITLYEIWKGINPEVIRYSSLVGMGDLMKNGCTTCFDHHYVFPQNTSGELIDVQFAAAEELGIRMHASRGSMSLSKKDGGLPPDSVVQDIDTILYDSERLVKKYHDSNDFSMRQVAFAPCSPFSVTGDLMKESAKLARKLGVRLHTHLAETKDEEKFTLEKFGMRPLEYMESLGWLGDDVWFAHGIHFNGAELKKLAETKTGVAHCPISNMKLSSGIAKIPQMLELDVPVGLAVDGSASNDGSNLLEELRVSYLLHRLNSSHKAPTGYDILKIATKGSARILGRKDIGELSVGKAADLFMINSNRMELVGTQYDPKSVLGTVGLKGTVDYTIVAGNIVVKDGTLVSIDEEKISREANDVVEKLIKNA
jgi:8-oxoguanine deaminase